MISIGNCVKIYISCPALPTPYVIDFSLQRERIECCERQGDKQTDPSIQRGKGVPESTFHLFRLFLLLRQDQEYPSVRSSVGRAKMGILP